MEVEFTDTDHMILDFSLHEGEAEEALAVLVTIQSLYPSEKSKEIFNRTIQRILGVKNAKSH